MRVIIVDDEITSSQVLDKLIQHYLPMLQVIAICNKPVDAIEKISELNPDLVFMDIELPGMTGFDILEKINPIHFNIIFTTAHSQYGIKAIQFSAIDYLLKPIDNEELIAAIQKLERHQTFYSQLQHLKEKIYKQTPFDKVNGILADFGTSQNQIINNDGFSFNFDTFLDMRMSKGYFKITAFDIINHYPEKMLSDIFFNYGEERHSRKIARAIVEERKKKRIKTNLNL